MKKLIFASIFLLATLAVSAQRFGVGANQDNTGRTLTYQYKSITIASTDSIAPNGFESFYVIPVAAAKTLHIKKTNAKIADRCTIKFTADATTRLLTMTGNDMSSDINRDTVSVMSSRSTILTYFYDGTKWYEMHRYQQH